ncbi:serine/threonine-protein kinase [Mycolicibacterium sp. CH28]|uniref:serine/threonine-protein kinase n=1 Tax=Mycolicibacterium sp. CH28 TaxID=2512237 RepID=UPI00138729CA|nr:serine/threonine-protein kinase [Mycolicibacterium sp. CH28]
MDPKPAEIAGFVIDSVLGAGGTGTVYLAHHSRHTVALKVYRPGCPVPPPLRLHHRNIVPIHAQGYTQSGMGWLAMQYVSGGDADTELRAGRMPPQRTVHIIGGIAAALDYAHAHGVVHGDVKPSNFLLAENVLLADFGVAPFSHDGIVLTSAAYASPEMLRGRAVDGQADIYSLGCSLFRLLTGKPPFFDAGPKDAVVHSHLHRGAPRATRFASWLPAAIDDVIATAMAKDPSARYPSAGELARAASRLW